MRANSQSQTRLSRYVLSRLDLLVGASLIVITIVVIITGSFAQPISDDYTRIWQVKSMGLMNYFKYHLLYVDGRFGNATILGLIYGLFGQKAIPFGALALCATTFISSYFLLNNFIQSRLYKSLIGLLVVVLAFASSTSMYDSWFWFNAASIYTISIPFAITAAAIAIRLPRYAGKQKKIAVIILVLLCAFIAGLNESISFSLIALLAPWIILNWRESWHSLVVVSFASLLGLLLNMFLPGSTARKHALTNYGTMPTGEIINRLPDALIAQARSISLYFFLASLVLIVVYLRANLGQKLNSESNSLRMKASILWIILAPMLLLFPTIAAFITGTYNDSGIAPLRAQLVAVFSSGLSLAIAFIVFPTKRELKQKTTTIHRRTALVLSALFILLIGAHNHIVPTASAVVVRNFQYKQRERTIQVQQQARAKKLYVAQVPLYFIPTEAQDMPATNSSSDTASWIRGWFGKLHGYETVYVDPAIGIGTCPYNETDWYVNGTYCASLLNNIKNNADSE